MIVSRIAHVAFQVPDLGAARHFYADVLGLVVTEETKDRLYLRGIEEYSHHSLVFVKGPEWGLLELGWSLVPDVGETELDWAAIEAKLTRLGCVVQPRSAWPDESWGRGLAGIDPLGFPVFFYEATRNQDRFMRQAHRFQGVAPMRLDHINLRVRDVERGIEYYKALGMRATESVATKSGSGVYAIWLRRKSTTHDVALVHGEGKRGFHHLALQVRGAEGLIRCLDVVADAGLASRIEYGPGRHGITNGLFLHLRDPFGTRVEIYADDYLTPEDAPEVKWTYEGLQTSGRNVWGPTPPDTFWELTPLLTEANHRTE